MEEKPKNIVNMSFSGRPENVGFARTAVAVFASQLDFTIDQIDELKVAVSEAVSNAIIHGCRGDAATVQMTLRLYDSGLEVEVADSGPGIADIEWAMQPGQTTEANRMGLGLVFIKEYMDDVTIESSPGAGTRVRMRKNLSQALKQ